MVNTDDQKPEPRVAVTVPTASVNSVPVYVESLAVVAFADTEETCCILAAHVYRRILKLRKQMMNSKSEKDVRYKKFFTADRTPTPVLADFGTELKVG